MKMNLRFFTVTLLATLLCNVWGEEADYLHNSSDSLSQSNKSTKKTNKKIIYTNASNLNHNNSYFVYEDGKLRVCAKKGNLTYIEFSFVGNKIPESNKIASTGTFDKNKGVWTGCAESVTFDLPMEKYHWKINKAYSQISKNKKDGIYYGTAEEFDGFFYEIDWSGATLTYPYWAEFPGEYDINESDDIYYQGDIKIPSQLYYGNKDFEDQSFHVATVTGIGKRAFIRSHISSLTIPCTISRISPYAFDFSYSLDKIIIDPDNPYYNTRNNSNVIVETATNTLVHCGNGAVIPKDINKIESHAFANLGYSTHYEIPKSVTEIASDAFNGIVGYTGYESHEVELGQEYYYWGFPSVDVSIEEGNRVYDSRYNCGSIIETEKNRIIYGGVIPPGVECIGSGAFQCDDLPNIPEGVKTIESGAFENIALDDPFMKKNIVIPSTVTSVGHRAFNGFFPMSMTEDTVTSYIICKAVEIPKVWTDTFMTEHPFLNNGFPYLTQMTLVVPDDMVDAYKNADVWKEAQEIIPLSSIALVTANSYTRKYGTPNPAFSFTAEGEELVGTPVITCDATEDSAPGIYPIKISKGSIENSITELVNGVLIITEDDPYAPIVFADDRVKTICVDNWDTNGDGVFTKEEAAKVASLGTVFEKSQISSFDELRFFTNLRSIGKNAFYKSTVQSITLPEGITELEEYAFLNCSSLTSINIPARVREVKQNALSRCTSMTTITVDEDNGAFCSISGVLFSKDKTTLIQFPAAKASTYTVPDGTKIIARDAFYQSKLESVILPSSLETLEYDAFGACRNLTDLVIPEGVTTIGQYLLDGCSKLKALSIPSSVTSIGQKMCNGCNAITDVYSGIQAPFDINSNSFPAIVYTSATLHVPYDTKEAYTTASGWNEFGNLVEKENPNPLYAILSEDKKTLTFNANQENNDNDGTILVVDDRSELPGWYEYRTTITKVIFDPSSTSATPKSLFKWFQGMENLEEIDGLEYLNTSQVVNMKEAFSGCARMKQIDVSGFDISHVTDLGLMFDGCTALASLDLSGFILSEGTNSESMLRNCSALKALELSESFSTVAASACAGVGTASAPCLLFTPAAFNFGVTATDIFQWKSGFFRSAVKPSIYANDIIFYNGQTRGIPVCLENGDVRYGSFQFELTLPEGFDFETKANGVVEYSLGNRFNSAVAVEAKILSDNALRFAVYALHGGFITGTGGPLLSISVKANGASQGLWGANLSNISINLASEGGVKCPDSSFNLSLKDGFPPGDVNHDIFINMSDVTTTILYILGQESESFHFKEADVDIDGLINMTDVTDMVSVILGKKGPEDLPRSFLTCPNDHHPHLIDLGLPSGTKWACCNVDASTPEGVGGYYAWGETTEKSVYNDLTYLHNSGKDADGDGRYEWYCDNGWGQYDDLGEICGTKYDVAHVKWGAPWTMPSADQVEEMVNNCTFEEIMQNDVKGMKFTGSNGGSIFLPYAGYRYMVSENTESYNFTYWSGTPHYEEYRFALMMAFSWRDSGPSCFGAYRGIGLNVRPVAK